MKNESLKENNSSNESDNCDQLSEDSSKTSQLKCKQLLYKDIEDRQKRLTELEISRKNKSLLQYQVEKDLKDEIGRLSRRLGLAMMRYDSALQVASKATDFQTELQTLNLTYRQLAKDHSLLLHEFDNLRHFLTSMPANRLIYMTQSGRHNFVLDTQAYTQLTAEELDELRQRSPEELSVKQLFQMKLSQVLRLFAEEINHMRTRLAGRPEVILRESDANCGNDQIGKNEISVLRNRLAQLEQDLVHEKQTAKTSYTAVNEFGGNTPQYNQPEEVIRVCDQPKCKDNLSMALLSKELEIVRQEKNAAMQEAQHLRRKLMERDHEVEAYRRKLKQLLSTHDDSRNDRSNRRTPSSRRLARAALQLMHAEAAKREAMLRAEKLSMQLDACKKAYYELEATAFKGRMELEFSLRETRAKLSSYEVLEVQLDEAVESVTYRRCASPATLANHEELLDKMEHVTFIPRQNQPGFIVLSTLAARRLEQNIKLSNRLKLLNQDMQKLKEDLTNAQTDAKDARLEATRLASIVSFSGQPVDCLVNALSQREQQVESLRRSLHETESELAQRNMERDKIANERDLLSRDLQRLLSTRQNLAPIRQEVASMLERLMGQCRTPNDLPVANPPNVLRAKSTWWKSAESLPSLTEPTRPPYDIDRS